MNNRPVMKAHNPRTDPTERSTLRVMMTTACPTANNMSKEGVNSRSRHPSPEVRKELFFTVAVMTTKARAMAMPNSRARDRWVRRYHHDTLVEVVAVMRLLLPADTGWRRA